MQSWMHMIFNEFCLVSILCDDDLTNFLLKIIFYVSLLNALM